MQPGHQLQANESAPGDSLHEAQSGSPMQTSDQEEPPETTALQTRRMDIAQVQEEYDISEGINIRIPQISEMVRLFKDAAVRRLFRAQHRALIADNLRPGPFISAEGRTVLYLYHEVCEALEFNKVGCSPPAKGE